MALNDIGARVVIDPGASVATLDEVTDATTRLNDALLKLGATADATMAKVKASGDASVVASEKAGAAATESGAAAEDAAIVGAGAVGKHKTALDDAGKATDDLKAKTVSLTDSVAALGSSGFAKLGRDSIIGALGTAGESIDQYMKYQKAMTQLVTQAGLPANRLPAIMAGGLQIGKQTGLDFNDIANQLYRIVSATSGLKETNKQILALGKSAADIAVLFNVSPGAPTEQVARLFGSLSNAGRSGKLQPYPPTSRPARRPA